MDRDEINPDSADWLTPLLAIFALGFLVAFRPIAGMDFHWQLGMGRAYLEQGLWLDEDPFTFLPLIRACDMGTWGAQSLFAILDAVGGIGAVRILIGALGGTLYAVAFLTAYRRTKDRLAAFLVVAVVATASFQRLRGRPDLFSLIGVFLLFDFLDRPPGRRSTGRLFLLTLIWANLHPGAVVAPLVVAVRAISSGWRTRVPQIAAVTLAVCMTPRGPTETIRLAWHTARTGPLVPEWRPLWSQPFADFAGEWFVLVAVTVLVACPLFRLRPWQRGLTEWLAIGFAWRATRLVYWIGPPLIETLARAQPSRWSHPVRRVVFGLAVVLLATGPVRDRLDAASRCRQVGLTPWADLFEPNYPIAAADFLENKNLEGRIYHPVQWGGYLGYRLAPKYRRAHDGRITLYGKDRAAELLAFNDPEQRRRLTETWHLEILVLPHGIIGPDEIATPKILDDPFHRWLPVYSDPVAAVYVDVRGRNWRHNRQALTR